jgi:hypothetical protein
VADRLLHREVLFETESALVGERRLRLAHVRCWMTISLGHQAVSRVKIGIQNT